MLTPDRCPRCGAPLTDLQSGLCPSCLFKLGLDRPHEITEDTATRRGEPPVPSGKETTSRAGELRAGDHIGPYRLIKILGEGGMGVVYLAEQEGPIRRTVALKLIKLGMDTRDVVARFEAERQALALMDHPNIASVFDAGATPDGRPYFVMEYAPGPPITDYCDSQRLTTTARLELFITVCGAIQHAHQKGIIHRDLKPSNVLVVEQDGRAVPKVIDFGIAKATNQRLNERTLFTQHGLLVGTPAYMSPEQAELGGVDLDTRTDIYALGVVLYELLVGTLPFAVTRLREAGYTELLRIIREEEPARPSVRLTSLGANGLDVAARRRTKVPTLAQQLRGDLDWITLKALDKDRTRRYASASEFAADLVRYLHNEPVIARPPSVNYRVAKFVRRNRLAVTAASLIAFAVIGSLIVSSVLYVQKERERREAIIQRERAQIAQRDAAAKADSEARQRQVAEASTAAETIARADAQRSLQAAETNLYFNNIDLADREIEAGNIAHADELVAESPTRLRGWEWNYLSRLAHTEGVSRRTAGTVRALVVSPDGSQITTASQDLTLQGWDANTLQPMSTRRPLAAAKIADAVRVWLSRDLRTLIGDVETITAGRLANLTTRNQTRDVWDLASGRRVLHLTSSGIYPSALAFTKDDDQVLMISTPFDSAPFGPPSDQLETWNVRTGQRETTLSEAAGIVRWVDDMSLSANGAIAVVTRNSGISLLDAAAGGTRRTLESSDGATLPTFSANGAQLAAAKNGITVWRTADGAIQSTIPTTRRVVRLAFNPDGGRVAAALIDGSVGIFDVATGHQLQRLTGAVGAVTALAFTSDASGVIAASDDGTIREWYPRSPVTPLVLATGDRTVALGSATLIQQANGIFAFSIAPGEPWGLRFQPFWWDIRTGTDLVSTWPEPPALTWSPCVSADGHMLAAPRPGRVDLLNPTTGQRLSTLNGAAPSTGAAYFELSPDGNRLAVRTVDEGITASGEWYSRTNGLAVWDVRGRRVLFQHEFPGGEKPWVTTFSRDGHLLALTIERPSGAVVRVVNSDTGRLQLEVSNVESFSSRPAFSADGTRMAVVTAGRGVAVADLTSALVRQLLPKQSAGNLTSMAFSPDRSRFVTALGGTIKLWDAESGRQVAILRESTGRITHEWTIVGRAGSDVPGPSRGRSEVVDFDDNGRTIVVTTYERHQQGWVIRKTVWDGSPRDEGIGGRR